MLREFSSHVVWAGAGILLVPALVYCVQCLLAGVCGIKRPRAAGGSAAVRTAVLIPAHNEAGCVAAAVDSVRPQLAAGDRVVVVADNCTDETAAVARAAGAEVIERTDASRAGKGFALDFGVEHLAQTHPPDVLVMLDADCVARPGAVPALVEQVVRTHRPAQAVYLMEAPQRPTPRQSISALAFLVKNLVRPLGFAWVGGPCPLTGSGMAFPWAVISAADLAHDDIVEDMRLGVELTLRGAAPRPCPLARVDGRLPEAADAAAGQRRRWEHGHLRTMLRSLPALLGRGVTRCNLAALGMALDLSVPPLSLLVMALTLAFTAAATGALLLGLSFVPAAALGGALAATALCTLLAWARFGRELVPARALGAIPLYVISKLPLYGRFVVRPQRQWNRTARDAEVASPVPAADDPRATTSPRRVDLYGVAIDPVTERECVGRILGELEGGRGGVVVTPNLDHLRRFVKDAEFASMVGAADLVVADGMPLVWASRLRGSPLPERVAGSNLIWSLSAAAADRSRSVFMLGGDPGTAEAAAAVLTARCPSLRIAGLLCPPLGFENQPEQLEDIARQVRGAEPDIIFVALGSPKQERLIQYLRPHLPQAWWLGVGFSFSFVAGAARRAPQWVQRLGLEWAHRLVQDPMRLAKRYLLQGLPFAARLMMWALRTRVQGRLMRIRASRRPASATPAALSPQNCDLQPAPAPRAATVVVGTPRTSPRASRPLPEGYRIARGLDVNGSPDRQRDVELRASLERLRAMVLLGGSVRPSLAGGALGRSILDLPLQRRQTLLGRWCGVAAELGEFLSHEPLPIRVLIDAHSAAPRLAPYGAPVSVERDPRPFRGTGGLLRDITRNYASDDLILLANANQLLVTPILSVMRELIDVEADVRFLAHRDGSPSSLMLIRCGALDAVAESGYVDLKEQALADIARVARVVPVQQSHPPAMQVRSFEQYLAAMRWLQERGTASLLAARNGTATAARATGFTVIEEGAYVHPSASLHDSVVLRGGRVEAGATLVRALVCGGALVGRGSTLVDSVRRPRRSGRVVEPKGSWLASPPVEGVTTSPSAVA